jgi:hypothetical protein
LYCVTEITTLQDNEIAVDELPTQNFVSAYYNFESKDFFEGATVEEIAEYQRSLVPQEVQLWKIRTVISLMGLKETIENVMNNLEEPTKSAALNIWNYGTAIDRNSQTVLMIQSILQMTEVEVDNIFIQANNIIL